MSLRTLCPTCWAQHRRSTSKWIFLSYFVLAAMGPLFWLLWPEIGVGRLLTNLLLFYCFMVLAILPHELGHAWMARLVGMRVFRIFLGSGKTLFTFRLFGFECEFGTTPLGGLVLGAHRTTEGLRLKQFAFVLAGPAMNAVMAAAVWPFLDSNQLWSLLPMWESLLPGLAFFYANLAVLVENLLPHNIATAFGPLPSDGKQLLQAFFISQEKRQEMHAASFSLEAAVCHERGDFQGAQSWLEKGLALYPQDETLLSWHGIVALDLKEYVKARECFENLLHRDSKQPLMRPLMQNNIAYTNALLGGEDLLKEADTLSQEAMEAMSWMPAVRGTRGTVLVAMGRFEEGLPLLHEAMSQAVSPNHKAHNACLIAETECRRGNLSVAQTYLEEARKLAPNCSLLTRAETALRDATGPAA